MVNSHKHLGQWWWISKTKLEGKQRLGAEFKQLVLSVVYPNIAYQVCVEAQTRISSSCKWNAKATLSLELIAVRLHLLIPMYDTIYNVFKKLSIQLLRFSTRYQPPFTVWQFESKGFCFFMDKHSGWCVQTRNKSEKRADRNGH